MEKYGTYDVFKDEETGEIVREPFIPGKEKKASAKDNLKKLKTDPQDEATDKVI